MPKWFCASFEKREIVRVLECDSEGWLDLPQKTDSVIEESIQRSRKREDRAESESKAKVRKEVKTCPAEE